MGWTGVHYYGAMTSKRRKEFCDKIWTQSEHDGYPELKVLKSTMIGNTYYAAVQSIKNGKSKVFGAVTSTSVRNHEFRYKATSEECGPVERRCPASILKLLSPTDNEWALNWRKECKDHNRKKKEKKTAYDLPVGTVIKITINGIEKTIVKKPPMYQFKRNWWYIPAEHKYYPVKHLPEEFEIVQIAR